MNSFFAFMILIASLAVILLLFIAFLPVMNAFAGLLTGVDAGTTLLINAMGILLLVVFLWAVYRKFTKDLNTLEPY